MKTVDEDKLKLFSNAGVSDNSIVYRKKFKINFSGNQGFVVPWQMTEKSPAEKVEEQVFSYSHF